MVRFRSLLLMVGAMWAVFMIDLAFDLRLGRYGIDPRRWEGLIGVLVWPFLHGSYAHIASNSVSMLLFGGIISARSEKTFFRLTIYAALMGGIGIWLIGRSAIHIGASGLVFAYFGYIVMRGFYDRSFLSLTIAGLVMLLFGGIVWGVLPTDPRISWEGHFLGMVAGAFYASRSRRKGYR